MHRAAPVCVHRLIYDPRNRLNLVTYLRRDIVYTGVHGHIPLDFSRLGHRDFLLLQPAKLHGSVFGGIRLYACDTILSIALTEKVHVGHLVRLEGIRVKSVYEGHRVEVKVKASKEREIPYSRNVKLQLVITPVL